jgi:transcriptional regulator with XRE-family HTH domain
MTLQFGARMRQHREQQGLSLSTIAARTKIKVSLLESLERGDISQWPPAIFRRAYVRTYAAAIGLDPDAIVREFLEIYPEPPEIVEAPAPPTGLRGLVGSALGSLSRIRHTVWAQPSPGPVKAAPHPDSASVRPHADSAQAPWYRETPKGPADAERAAEPPRPEPRELRGAEPREPAGGESREPVRVERREPTRVKGPTRVERRVATASATVPTIGRVASPDKAAAETKPRIDLLAAARLCTELGRVETAAQVEPLLREAAALLDAKSLIVWVWDAVAEQLRPVLVHGYSAQAVARLPGVGRDDDNVTAAAFRSAQTLAVGGTADSSGALALPLLTPGSCAGVLTIELPPGSWETGSVRAVATFFAAMIAQLVGGGPPAASESEARHVETSAIARS